MEKLKLIQKKKIIIIKIILLMFLKIIELQFKTALL